MKRTPIASTNDLPARLGDLLKRHRETLVSDGGLAEEVRERERRQALVKLAGQLGKRYAPHLATLEGFEIYHEGQRPVLAAIREIASDLRQFVADGRSLVLYGTVGTGKDHMLAALLYAAVGAGCSCEWLSGQEFYGATRDRIEKGQPEHAYLERLAAPDVLGISDPIPPVGKPSPWNVLMLARLLDRRNRSCRCTWVTVNAICEQDLDEKLSAPVWDRMRDGAVVLRCCWPSYRGMRR